jgi:hypothetical protein
MSNDGHFLSAGKIYGEFSLHWKFHKEEILPDTEGEIITK